MTNTHTIPKTKIAITLDPGTLRRVDQVVAGGAFHSRSAAIAAAVAAHLDRVERGRLARECAKLNPQHERHLAELGLAADLAAWPEY